MCANILMKGDRKKWKKCLEWNNYQKKTLDNAHEKMKKMYLAHKKKAIMHLTG